MAQKTPLPAKTVMYADRFLLSDTFNSTDWNQQLMKEYHLRFILTSFLRLKRQWLHLLSIHKSGGFYFFNVVTLNYLANSKVKNLLEQTDKSKNLLTQLSSQLKQHPALIHNADVKTLTELQLPAWKKRVSAKKARTWLNLRNNSRIVMQDAWINPTQANNQTRVKLPDWMKNNQHKLALNYYYQPLTKFFGKAKVSYVALNGAVSRNSRNIINKDNKSILNTTMQKRTFTTQTNNNFNTPGYQAHGDKQLVLLNRMLTPFQSQTQTELMHTNFSKHTFLTKKNNLAMYQTANQVVSYFYKRIFKYKKYKSIKVGYTIVNKKYSQTLRYRRLKKRISTSVLFMCRALQRISGLRFFLSYVPLQWEKNTYHPLKKFVVFEKFGNQKYFTSTISVVHLALSRGSATLLTDLLVRKLRKAHTHTFFLSCVEKICRYFMADYESHVASTNSLCKGVEILFKGKLNGGTRSKTWRFKFGPVHTSTFFTNTREEHAKCMTRYGIFHIRVRLKVGLASNA